MIAIGAFLMICVVSVRDHGLVGEVAAAWGPDAPPAVLVEVERSIEPVMEQVAGVQPEFVALEPAREDTGAEPVEFWISWPRRADGSIEVGHMTALGNGRVAQRVAAHPTSRGRKGEAATGAQAAAPAPRRAAISPAE